MTDLDLILINDQGRRWGIRVVPPDGRYGLDDVVVNDHGESMVEFYDYTYIADRRFGPRGQFVSRYLISTLRSHGANGLNLEGGVPDWSVDADLMLQVQRLIKPIYDEEEE